MKPSRRRSGESSSARSGGTIVTWLHMHEKFAMPSALARLSVSAVDGAVVSKPMAKKTTSRSGFSLARCAARRAASRPSARRRPAPWRRCSVPSAPGTRSMSPKQVKITPGLVGDRDAVVDAPHRDHAHRAARAVHELDVRRQQVVDAVLVDRVGVPAAHLHDLVVAARLDRGEDLARQRPPELGVAELVDELHAAALARRRAPGVDEQAVAGRDGATSRTSTSTLAAGLVARTPRARARRRR